MGGLGTTEIILIVAVLFLLFGASRLPQLAKSFGQTRKAFKDGMKEAEEEEKMEERQKQLGVTPVAPQINSMPVSATANSMSDEELMAEMRRRAEVKN